MRSVANTNNLTQPPIQVIQRGWEALNKTIGYTDALRFVMSLTAGQGDSVKFFKRLWVNRGIDEIHQEILKAKKNKKI